MNVGRRVDFDKLLAEVNGKRYRIKSFTLNLVLNAPAACSVILAQGLSKSGEYKFNNPAAFEEPFTPITVELYMEGQKDPIILFRGYVANVSKTASRNANGSYAGTALACIAPPSLLQAARLQGYKYWVSPREGKGPETATESFRADAAIALALNEGLHTYGTDKTYEGTRFPENVGNYITEAMGHFVNVISRNLYTPEAVTVHKMQRGIDITPDESISSRTVEPEEGLVKQIKSLMKRTDAYSTLRAMVSGPLYMTMVPSPCGAFDIIPEFPWAKNPLTTIKRDSYLELTTTGNFMGDVALVDSIYVNIGFSGTRPEGFVTYPESVAVKGVSGVAKTAVFPPWMSPYVGYKSENGSATAPEGDNAWTGADKAGIKKTASDIEEIQETADTLAEKLARMAYNRVKSSGSTMQIEVPWFRLEFLHALGYLIQIEKTNESATEEEDLYGYLNAATLAITSTTGGSSAKMKLGFSHVRGEGANADAFDEHPFWVVTDTFRDNFAAIDGSVNSFNRADQVSLDGDTFEDYLNEVKGLMNG